MAPVRAGDQAPHPSASLHTEAIAANKLGAKLFEQADRVAAEAAGVLPGAAGLPSREGEDGTTSDR